MRSAIFFLTACSSAPAAMDAATDSSAADAPDVVTMMDAKSDAPPMLSCADYCDALGVTCVGPNVQFYSTVICAAQCALFAKGTFGDMGNTLGCRQYHGGDPATADPNTHCRHAGPSGGGLCGTRCDAFCQLTFGVCVPANKNAMNPFSSIVDCMTQCASWAVDTAGPELDTTNKNTLNCRFYELELAWSDPAGGSAKNHCPNLVTMSMTCTK
jgi:hypothetical protein